MRALALVAEDDLTDEQIANKVGIDRATLHRWKQDPNFKADVADAVEQYRQEILTQGIANRVKRVAALDDRWNKLQQIITERGESDEFADAPGGTTGLLVKQVKSVGAGLMSQIVEEYAVDTGLLAELRNHEKQAAQELGQWTDKVAPTDPSGQNEYVGLSADERAARLAALLERARTRRDGQSADGADVGGAGT